MLKTATLAEQIEAGRPDRLRTLIVGAGVAGRTLAQLLRRQGLHPALIEKAGPDAASGYMLALMPLVDPALDTLNINDPYQQRSTPLHRYAVRSHTGAPIREYDMTQILDHYGDYRGISRGELLNALDTHPTTITHHTTVTAIKQTGHTTTATITHPDGTTTADFDLIVTADGIGSATADLILNHHQITRYDTGWGGWVTWGDLDDRPDLAEELWGSGMFLGSYPVKGRLGVILCGHRDDTRVGPQEFAQATRSRLKTIDARTQHCLDQVTHNEEKFYWPLIDRRCATWTRGRVVLLGDAAAGFLPTAGIGACMAIESAAVLAHHLSTTNRDQITHALHRYETAQRPRVEAAQDNSRTLARLMFSRSTPLALIRDIAARFVSIETALRPIRALLDDQPDTSEAGTATHP